MSVIREDNARRVNAKISPYDRSKIKAMTADGKEVKDVLFFAEVEVTLGNLKLTNARMLVFKNLTNPCLVGRDILSAHPKTKDHFEVLMGRMEDKPQCQNKLDDDNDEMDDLKYDNADFKGVGPRIKPGSMTQLARKPPSTWTEQCARLALITQLRNGSSSSKISITAATTTIATQAPNKSIHSIIPQLPQQRQQTE